MANSDEGCSGPNCRQEGSRSSFGTGGAGGGESKRPPFMCPPGGFTAPGSEGSQCAHLTDYAGAAECVHCDCPGPPKQKTCEVTIRKEFVEVSSIELPGCHLSISVRRCDGTTARYDVTGIERSDEPVRKAGGVKLGRHLYRDLQHYEEPTDGDDSIVCRKVFTCPDDCDQDEKPCCDKLTDEEIAKYVHKDEYGGSWNSPKTKIGAGLDAWFGFNSNTFVGTAMEDICGISMKEGGECPAPDCARNTIIHRSLDFYGNRRPGFESMPLEESDKYWKPLPGMGF